MTEAEREDKERVKREKIRKFESPIPFVIIFRNWIFGKKKPDIYTRITFFINLTIWATFITWSGISYFALISKQWIWQQKGIPVKWIIERRGKELGFEPGVFVDRLESMNLMALFCWLTFFIGLVFLYRKKRRFTYFTFIPLLIFIVLNMFYMGFTYFIEDTTSFDKIALLIMALSLGLHSFLMNNERKGGSISFFGEVPDEED